MRHVPRLLIRLGAVLTVTTATAAFLAAPAEAAGGGVAWVTGNRIKFKAAASGANRLVITRSGRTITIDDKRAIKPGKGCKQVKGDKTRVRCTAAQSPTRVRVELRGGNDVVTNRTDVPLIAYGNDGDDRLYGGSLPDFLYGGSGADKLDGRAGSDYIYGASGSDKIYGGTGGDYLYAASGNDLILGGDGDDQLYGELGRDRLDGGAGNDQLRGDDYGQGAVSADVLLGGTGRDSVSYNTYRVPVSVNLDGRANDGKAGEKDTVGADVEDIEGGSAGDRLIGSTANNYLQGWSGSDVLYGGAGDDVLEDGLGRDFLYGEAGDDDLRAIDNGGTPSADRVDGGVNGTKGDLCLYNSPDTLIGCEESSNE